MLDLFADLKSASLCNFKWTVIKQIAYFRAIPGNLCKPNVAHPYSNHDTTLSTARLEFDARMATHCFGGTSLPEKKEDSHFRRFA